MVSAIICSGLFDRALWIYIWEWCASVDRPAERTGLHTRGKIAALRSEESWSVACQRKPKNKKESIKR